MTAAARSEHPQPASRPVRAAVARAFGASLEIGQVALRGPRAGEVGIRVAACAICHSDVTLMTGAWGGDLPAVYGHEASGVIEEVGDGVTGMRPGDHAVVTLVRFCGRCAMCLRGQPALCEARVSLARLEDSPLRTADGVPIHQGLRVGGFAERVTVHESQVVRIPEDVSLESASLLGCGVITGVGAVLTTAAVEVGSTVAVIGLGGVGLNAVQGAALAGARLIVGVDRVTSKLATATGFGATHAVDAAGDVFSAVMEMTGGRGLDHVFVTAPSAAAIEGALPLLADAGALVLVGMPPNSTVAIDPETVAERSLRILGSKVGSARPQGDIPRLVDLHLQGRLKLDELISHRYPLDQINEAIAVVERGDALKAVVVL